jgi:asparagine synthase (glutamine-hydrolysing)
MMGLLGLFSVEHPDDCRRRLRAMVSSLPSEDFDLSGTYEDPKRGVYVGWSCHKNAVNARLPISNENGDKRLFMTGEVFPAGDIARLLEVFGVDGLKRLNGWFSGLFIDEKAGASYLFNDRYGMRRLFIHETGWGLLFSSHAKALLAVVPESREFDPTGLAEYIACDCVLGGRSLFNGISVFPAGSVWTVRGSSVVERAAYFDRSAWEGQPRLPGNDYEELIRGALPGIVRKYGEAPSPVGLSLTGGLDMRMVVSCLDMAPGQFPCYTFGSMYRDTFDVKIARKVAAGCNQDHTTLILGRDFLNGFSNYLEEGIVRSDGCLGFPAAAALYVNASARGLSPFRLTGNYASELLRGVRAFKPRLPAVRFYDRTLDEPIDGAFRTFRSLETLDPISFSLFVQAPSLGYGLYSVEESQLTVRTPFMDNALAEMAYRGPRSYAAGAHLSISAIRRCRPDLLRIPSDFGYLGSGPRLVRSVRRGYYRALFKGEYWSSHGMPQGLAMAVRLFPWLSPEKFFLGRHKYQHFRKWLTGDLAPFLRDFSLSAADIPELFDRRTVLAMIEDHIQGRRNYLSEIDKVVTMTLVKNLFFHPGIGRDV